jgi:hypothetical protein
MIRYRTVCEASPVDLDPEKPRTNALLWEMCVKYGWCDVRYQAAAFHRLVASGAQADEVVDAILRAEGAALDHPHRDAYLQRVVMDWLFDPDGQGARSGRPLL